MASRSLTILDIAKQLNISKSTVSRALRDSHDVKPETRQKVLNLIKQLDFEPNPAAISLRKNKTLTIGVVIPSYRIPFYSSAISGIQEVASAAGYNVLTCQSNESFETEVSNVNSLVRSRVDGIILSLSKFTSKFNHIEKLQQKGLPIVLFNRISDQLKLPMVTVDDYKSSWQACEYMIQRGCRKIAHISGPSNLNLAEQRKAGYIDCLLKNQLPIVDQFIIESDFSIESGMKAAEQILKMDSRPDAIFCVCDAVAFGVMMVLKNNNIRIPEDISIMGYTDEPVAALVDPPLTTISQPIFEIGKTAAEILFKLMNKRTYNGENLNVKLETKLVVRKSIR